MRGQVDQWTFVTTTRTLRVHWRFDVGPSNCPTTITHVMAQCLPPPYVTIFRFEKRKKWFVFVVTLKGFMKFTWFDSSITARSSLVSVSIFSRGKKRGGKMKSMNSCNWKSAMKEIESTVRLSTSCVPSGTFNDVHNDSFSRRELLRYCVRFIELTSSKSGALSWLSGKLLVTLELQSVPTCCTPV